MLYSGKKYEVSMNQLIFPIIQQLLYPVGLHGLLFHCFNPFDKIPAKHLAEIYR